MDYSIAAVERALALLEMVADNPGIGLTELARRIGCTKTLAFRVAATLETRGYVRKDPESKSYTLGYQPLRLVGRLREEDLLLRVSAPQLDTVSAATQENVSLLVRDGLETVCVAIRQSPQPIRLYAELGRRGPLHVGGGPKLLLAYAPPAVIAAVMAAPMERFTPTTVTEPAKLATLLRRIRQQGHNISDGDMDAGAFSLAAPVFDHTGQVVASLSVAGPQARLTQDKRRAYVALVREAAEAVSKGLGWPG